MSLLEQLRALGLTMGGRYPAQEVEIADEEGERVTVTQQGHYGYTTDEAKAEAAREAGATVTTCRSKDPRFTGWEIAVTEVAR